MNLNLPANDIKEAMKRAWNATDILDNIPEKRVGQLVQEKYTVDAWNLKF